MIIGGQAMLLYGEPRLTKDIDVTLGVGTERISDIISLISELGWEILVDSPDRFVQKTWFSRAGNQPMEYRSILFFSFCLMGGRLSAGLARY